MKADWTEKLKSKIESSTQPAPDGLWEEIAASSAAGKKKTSPALFVIPLLAAACAAALLFIPTHSTESSINSAEETILADNSYADVSNGTTENTLIVSAIPEKRYAHIIKTNAKTEVKTEVKAETSEVKAVHASEENELIEETPQPLNSKKNSDSEIIQPADQWYDEYEAEIKRGRGMALSMNLGGTAGQYSNADASVALASTDATALRHEPALYGSNALFRTTPDDYSWRVSYKLNVLAQMYIGKKMHVSTGLSLTALEGNTSYDLQHTDIYHVGVPVILGYDLFRSGRLSASANVGATPALCIKASSNLDSGRFQMSSNYGLSVRYSLGRSIALQGGLGADTYFPVGNSSVFRKVTTLANASAGLVWIIN